MLQSKKFPQVVFRILMGVIGYNLMNLFLNSEGCQSFEEFSLKTLRQKRVKEKSPEYIIYAGGSFAVLRQSKFLPTILELKRVPRKKLARRLRVLDAAAGFT